MTGDKEDQHNRIEEEVVESIKRLEEEPKHTIEMMKGNQGEESQEVNTKEEKNMKEDRNTREEENRKEERNMKGKEKNNIEDRKSKQGKKEKDRKNSNNNMKVQKKNICQIRMNIKK